MRLQGRAWRTRPWLRVDQRGLMMSFSVAPRAHTAMGERARESGKQGFLTIRVLEQYLDLLVSLETAHRVPEPGRVQARDSH
jgi:hypothetical protein